MGIDKINKRLHDAYGGQVRAEDKGDYIVVTGRLKEWKDIVAACGMCVQKGKKNRKKHVVNDIVFEGGSNPGMRMPGLRDSSLEGAAPDVLIIGGGISGASIARELSRWQLDILLVDKEADLAVQASGRNDGEVHPGVDLGRGTLKQHYVVKGNRMFDKLCRDLDVPFQRCGQYAGFTDWYALPLVWMYAQQRRLVGQ